MKLLLKQEANQVTRLRDALEEISEAYDYCICDCGRLLDMVVQVYGRARGLRQEDGVEGRQASTS